MFTPFFICCGLNMHLEDLRSIFGYCQRNLFFL